MVWRSRRRAKSAKASLWPGGWLITYDRKVDPTYKAVNTADTEPLVLTPGQWATLVTETASAPEVRDLIEAAASFLRQEAVLRIAVKYPPDVALNLARTLEQGGASETDFRVAQLTLVDLLNGASGQTQNSGSRFLPLLRVNGPLAWLPELTHSVKLFKRRGNAWSTL
jgi:hypothetical protein